MTNPSSKLEISKVNSIPMVENVENLLDQRMIAVAGQGYYFEEHRA